jgi:hypothetical protein
VKRRRPWWFKLALACALGALAFVVLAELGLRVFQPPAVRLFDGPFSGGPGERMVKIDRRYEVHPEFGIYQVDDELGFRPVLGGAGYGPHGCKWNEYAPEKPAGKRRMLFLGDSVTERQKIVDALRARLGEDWEYWNAGVPAYATEQELGYYRDYLGGIDADHVVLTFHLNDYETTPIVFEVDGELVSVHSRVGTRTPSPWLMRNSYLYRFVWTFLVARTGASRKVALEADVARALGGLRDLVAARGAELTVLVLPWLQERSEWPPPKPRHHELTVQTLAELGIRHHAFLDTLDRAIASAVPVCEHHKDPQHPSAEFAALMVEDLLAAGFAP